MQRGRPRHDDILTPREWEVLALVRDGLTNEQIAQRLDVSLATAKFHVSEIMGKLGVESRQAAAKWPGKPQRLRASFTLPLLQRIQSDLQVQSVGRTATLAVLVVALLSLVLLAAGIAFNSRGTVEEARLPPIATVVEPVTETTVIVYRPTMLPAEREQGENCMLSPLLARDGAWACWGGRSPGLSQPCFGEAGELEVVCPGRPEPGFQGAYVLELEEPLDLATPTPRPGAPTPVPPDQGELARRAWVVETADGRMCGFKTGGTSPVVNGERINFYCGDDDYGLIGLPTPGIVWTARQVPLPADGMGQNGVAEVVVELRTVWR